MTARAAWLGAALVVLVVAWRRSWLTAGGLAAAVVVGAAVWAGTGTDGLALLLVFFVSSSVAGRALPGGAGPRSAPQVIASGGVAALCAGTAALGPAGAVGPSTAGLVGALGAATADTWASEIGEASRGTTRSIATGRRVAPGAPGGVSAWGTLAGAAGALTLAGSAALLGVGGRGAAWVLPGVVAGVGGMLADSLLGATLEGRVGWVDNQAVNAVGTAVGAGLGWALL